MKFTYQVDEADFVSAGKLFSQTRRGAKVRLVVVSCCWLILAFLLGCYLFSREFTLAAYFAVLLLAYSLVLARSRDWLCRRQYRRIPALHDPRTLEADGKGLHMVTSLTDGRSDWEILERFAENERAFILVQQGGRIFIPISKRQMTPDDIAGFRSLCAQHIGPR